MAKILAVETSGFEGSAAVMIDGHVTAERTPRTEGRRHAQTLVLEIDQLLANQNLQPSDIDAVAVSVGPGSFTGLRVGVVFAKTFVWANQSKLLAVDTFQALAHQALQNSTPPAAACVCVISDAQRGEVFFNRYRFVAGDVPEPVGSVNIRSPEDLVDAASTAGSDIPEGCLMTGPGLQKHAETLQPAFPLAAEQHWQPKASAVARIGQALFDRDQFADPYTLEPVYIRRSYAEEQAAATDR